VDVDLDKKQIKEKQKAAKQAEKSAKQAEREAKEAADRKMAGREIASELLSMGQVKIFENGYVIVGWNFGSPSLQNH
jgi:F0F1-type ATP synthase assembly protein I